MTFAKSIHQLSQVGRALDLEEDFVVVIGDLDVEVLNGSRCRWRWRRRFIRRRV